MTNEELEAAIKTANLWSGRSILVLGFGILGEYVLLPFLEKHRWHKWAKIFFAILVVAGIVGEYQFSTVISERANELQRASDGDVSAANERASNADLKRAELQAKMLEIFGPRTLFKAQADRIASKLSRLAGIKVDVLAIAGGNPWSESESHEARTLARSIVTALTTAHVDAMGWIGSCQAGASNLVIAALSNRAEIRQAAFKIKEALSPEIATFPELMGTDLFASCQNIKPLTPGFRREPGADIKIVVGRKVPPLLTPEMLGIERPVTLPQR